jgi:hypothetical protein
MRARRFVAAVVVAASASAALVLTATPASARRDPIVISPAIPASVWVQSFVRASADAPCVTPPDLVMTWLPNWNPADEKWIPTWEYWPNNGTGGWTCTRSITWAPGAPAVYERLPD